jgi:chaperonin GroEL
LSKVGKEWVVLSGEGKGIATELEIAEGVKVEIGFISLCVMTNADKMEVWWDNPHDPLTDKRIALVQQDSSPILEQIAKTQRPSQLIEDVEKEALATSILNQFCTV